MTKRTNARKLRLIPREHLTDAYSDEGEDLSAYAERMEFAIATALEELMDSDSLDDREERGRIRDLWYTALQAYAQDLKEAREKYERIAGLREEA